MSTSVELVLLKCPQCSTPVPAEEDEVAWVCQTCGLGLQLTAGGLAPLSVRWSARRVPKAQWLPFWVLTGTARFTVRESYGGQAKQNPLWEAPRRFYVPAYPAGLHEIEVLGSELTRAQVPLEPGPPAGPLQHCTLLPEDARGAAEFIVMTIEADRKDTVRNMSFTLDVGGAELWLLAFEGGREFREFNQLTASTPPKSNQAGSLPYGSTVSDPRRTQASSGCARIGAGDRQAQARLAVVQAENELCFAGAGGPRRQCQRVGIHESGGPRPKSWWHSCPGRESCRAARRCPGRARAGARTPCRARRCARAAASKPSG